MTKYILVGGYLRKASDGGKSFCQELVKGFDQSKSVKILDCFFALPKEDWISKIQEDQIRFSKYINNFEIILADQEKFAEQVKQSDIIFLKGGDTELLMEILKKSGNWIKELNGKTLAGTSAGAEAISKYYYIVDYKKLGNGFNLLPIKLIPHWHSNSEEYQNLDWSKALQELKDYKEDLPIYTLKEGEYVIFEK